MIKSFKIFEKLGYATYLYDIVKDVRKHLEKNNKYTLKTKLHNKDITVYFEYDNTHNNTEDGFFQVKNPETYEFSIYLTDLTDELMIHEIKHLDYVIRRDLKVDSYFYLSTVGKDITNKLKSLLYRNSTSAVLIDIFYFLNPNEFEAQFNGFYAEILNIVKDISDNKEKHRIIKEFLEKQDIYKVYKFLISRNGFDISDFFATNKHLNKYLEILTDKIDSYHSDNETEYLKFDNSIKMYLNNILYYFKKDKDISKTAKTINKMMNIILQKYWKKLHRLYTI